MFVERSGNKDGTLRGSLSVLLVGDEEVQKAQPREALLALSEPALDVVEAALEQASSLSTKADVVMVLFGGGEEAALGCLQGLAECSPRPVLFALLGEQSEALMRRVLRAGTDEVLFLPLVQGDLMRTLLKVSEARRRIERRAGGMIVSVTSMGGGAGITTLCANLGLALLSAGGVRVALVDLDLQNGGLGNLLGAEPERGILALARLNRKPDSITLEAALTKHASGLYVLSAPVRIEDSDEVSDTTVSDLLDLLRQLFDYIVVDCGAHVDENSVAAWERSHEVLYAIEQAIGAAHRAGRFLELFQRLGIDRIEPRLVLNRFQPNHPITEAHIVSTLKCPIYVRIPRDERVMEKSVALAQMPSQVAPNSALVHAYEELARRISASLEVTVEAEPRSGPGFVARLLGSLGARA
jgi:pilus assembly protein CpaE